MWHECNYVIIITVAIVIIMIKMQHTKQTNKQTNMYSFFQVET